MDLGLGSAIAEAQPSPATPTSVAALLRASRWQKRVSLLGASTADNARLRRQQRLLEPARAEVQARDLLVREVIIGQFSAADKRYLTQRLGVATGTFTVVLLGKDGGVKCRENQPLPAAALFAAIEAMPMPQREMREQR